MLVAAGSCARQGQPPGGSAAEGPTHAAAKSPVQAAAKTDSLPIAAPAGPTRLAQDLLNESPRTAQEHLEFREALDETLWKNEVQAQEHERPFIRLWDELRTRPNPFDVLKDFPFAQLRFKELRLAAELDLDVKSYALSGKPVSLDPAGWAAWLSEIEAGGYRIVQTEWHHSHFVPATEVAPASSLVSFVIDIVRAAPARRTTIRGDLVVHWAKTPGDDDGPVADVMEAKDVTVWVRDAPPAFEPMFTAKTDAAHKRLMPLVVYDLNRDGLSEILLGGLNKIYWNEGRGRFRAEPIAEGLDIFDTGIVADFTADGLPDFICIGVDRRPSICVGQSDGRFRRPIRCADVRLEFPKSMTAGDLDQDGDLDLWIGQYKFPYMDGSMPTPFYDANDGHPAFLLVNDGAGSFADATEAAGLAAKRNRRTYSSSLVDLDGDRDLDLMTVSDFCGVDMYRNDGNLRFSDVTDAWVDERRLFGMGHALADFNLDARLDMYVIGMSSTTARRLDRLQLGRDDHPEINRMRQAMGYGNRLLLRTDEVGEAENDQHSGAAPLFRQATFNDRLARTGWSWGTTAFDFDNDGDRDIYVANGHNSGRSAQDYCTTYWCHDVYTGSSQESAEMVRLFRSTLRDLHLGEISWNGFEHDVLFVNNAGKDFANLAFLFGVAFEFDGRGVVGEDLDADGRPDLLVVEYRSERADHTEYTLHVLRNQLETNHGWIGVRLSESPGGPSPIGANIVVKTPRRTHIHRVVTGDSFSSQHPTAAHFGLGDETAVGSIEIQWPDGGKSVLKRPAPGRYYHVRAGD
jgi:hypothetical protein